MADNTGNVGIYKITSPTGSVYIGQSFELKKRFRTYRVMDTKRQPKIHSSLVQHTPANHIFEVIHELPNDVSVKVMNDYEILYMKTYTDLGFPMLNIREGGSRGKHSEESKKRMSAAQKGREVSLETRKKNSLKRLGSKASEETKLRISLANKGRTVSDITKEKIKRTKEERGIKISIQFIENGKSTRFKKGSIPWSKGKTGIFSAEVIAANRNRKASDETKAKIKAVRAKQVIAKGRKHSDETRKKMSKSAIKRGYNIPEGYSHSQETRKKISLANKGRVSFNKGRTGSLSAVSRKVVCTVTGVIYDSVTEAAIKSNMKRTAMANRLLGITPNNTTLIYYNG